MSLYQDGLLIASTATNEVTYVAMEDLTATVALGASSSGAAFVAGTMAFAVLCQTNLSASNHWAIYQLLRSYFGI